MCVAKYKFSTVLATTLSYFMTLRTTTYYYTNLEVCITAADVSSPALSDCQTLRK